MPGDFSTGAGASEKAHDTHPRPSKERVGSGRNRSTRGIWQGCNWRRTGENIEKVRVNVFPESSLTVALDTLLVMSYVSFFGKVRNLCFQFYFFTFFKKENMITINQMKLKKK